MTTATFKTFEELPIDEKLGDRKSLATDFAVTQWDMAVEQLTDPVGEQVTLKRDGEIVLVVDRDKFVKALQKVGLIAP